MDHRTSSPRLLPPPSAAAAPPSLITPTSALVRSFLAHDTCVDTATQHITTVLSALLESSRARTHTLEQLDHLRAERERVLAEELAGQSRSRDLLARAKEEMAIQEAWADEVRELWARAGMEGVDIAEVGEEEWPTEDRGSEASRRADGTERAVALGRQLLYLTHSTHKSETRLRALLHQLSTTRTSHVSQAALAQLRDETVRWNEALLRRSEERQELRRRLGETERERAKAEEKRDEVVLDLVLEWRARQEDEPRRRRYRGQEARKVDEAAGTEQDEPEQEEQECAVLARLQAVAFN